MKTYLKWVYFCFLSFQSDVLSAWSFVCGITRYLSAILWSVHLTYAPVRSSSSVILLLNVSWITTCFYCFISGIFPPHSGSQLFLFCWHWKCLSSGSSFAAHPESLSVGCNPTVWLGTFLQLVLTKHIPYLDHWQKYLNLGVPSSSLFSAISSPFSLS